eukprot:g12267.t1
MLVRHMLETVQALHRVGLYHGHLTPDCFRFHSDQAHAPLKLVDFGLELKACLCERSPDSGHEQILAPSKATARDWPRSSSPHLFEACKVVFCAPEVFQHMKAAKSSSTDLGMDFLIQADIWSVGAIAFLLLCGYPPFFAPCRSAIISRVEKIELACLAHGEVLVARSLAKHLSYKASLELQLECEQADKMKCGFLTSADLRQARHCNASMLGETCPACHGQVLQASGHSDIVEAIGSCFARHLKHAGESYLDYNALFDSVRLRREALLEEEIWQAFVKHATDQEISTDREFHRSDLETFFEAFDLSKVCGREGAQEGIRSSKS